jgi:hypothetical protein
MQNNTSVTQKITIEELNLLSEEHAPVSPKKDSHLGMICPPLPPMLGPWLRHWYWKWFIASVNILHSLHSANEIMTIDNFQFSVALFLAHPV